MRTSTAISAVLVVCGIVSCTYNEPRLRPEPIAAAVGTTNFHLQGATLELEGLNFRCVEWHSLTNYPAQWMLELFTGWHSAMDECVYLTVDPAQILPLSHDRNINTIAHKTDTLLAISDYNCANFLAGAFAAKTNTDFGSSVASTILSGTSSILGLASGVPALVPASISGGNAAIAGGTAAFDSNFFAKQSFDIMETGILASRRVQRTQIEARICESYPEKDRPRKDCSIPPSKNYPGFTPNKYWTMSEALSDVIEYDRTCSIEGGLRELSGQAAQSQKKADEASGQRAPASPGEAASPAPSPGGAK